MPILFRSPPAIHDHLNAIGTALALLACPPSDQLLGVGYDVVQGQLRAWGPRVRRQSCILNIMQSQRGSQLRVYDRYKNIAFQTSKMEA